MKAEVDANPDVYDLSAPFLLSPGGTRLLEIQPTLRCNLRCTHCYSESGPERRGELSASSMEAFLIEARHCGYRYVGVSGGEPLLWKGLDPFLDFASDAGYAISVSTNGTLLDADKAARLRGRAGLVAVSVDGPPEEHAAIRGSTRAFPAMQQGLAALRDAGVPFTMAFTLTRFNADKLSWFFDFADREGAIGVHIHPLCDFGAASVHLSGNVPDSLEFKVASWLLALKAEQRGPGGPAVTMDVIKRAYVEHSCWPMLAERGERLMNAPFSDLVPALVVEPDGCIVPFIYGFPRSWALGYLGKGCLDEAIAVWRRQCAAPVAATVHGTLDRLATANAEYIDLFAEILLSARQTEAGDTVCLDSFEHRSGTRHR